MADDISFGQYLKLYAVLESLSALSPNDSQAASKMLSEGALKSPSHILHLALRALPSGMGIRTLREFGYILQEFWNSLPEIESAEQIEQEFLHAVRTEQYRFSIPIARAIDYDADVTIGGRYELALRTDLLGSNRICMLCGGVEAVHWSTAHRLVSELADEMAGTLLGLGLADFAPMWLPTGVRGGGIPPLCISLSTPRDDDAELEEWSDEFAVSWQQRHNIWGTALFRPPDLTDLERRDVDQNGLAHALRPRFELAAKLFSIGGMDAKRLRRAARFLWKASTAESPGDSYLFLATCLEGFLVDGKGDLKARICDAVGFALGDSFAERHAARQLAAHLYDVRSQYVHEGEYTGSDLERFACLEMAGKAVAHEIRVLLRS
jgi:hypothetical protein